ncbi:3',5'-cyclic-AMP phosphodiesterase [Sansalvadorimonas sp. 2012CJ34-2]|uniref:3',5'-cyclic-AMP phosphodiesterase n=1 Tax=Parendozoicomonas callyspongiae TaxID=2942213 RepID=A0ABT0PLC3_9GAMM|nr:3',5'-cyclic-AMP phosphodiesterase [Sansalvadorimonas sp. 2012CJ34-2]
MQKEPLTLIQFTDPHLFGDASKDLMGIKTCQSFADVVELARSQESQIDHTIVTGDISQDYSIESYEFCHDLMTGLDAPTVWLFGNHDEAEDLKSSKFADLFPKAIKLGNWNIVLLSSQIPGKTHGELADQELTFLWRFLDENPDTPTLLAMHHHPLCISSPWMDSMPVTNGKELVESLKNYPQVKLLIHGHIHQERDTEVNGVHILATPSTSVQFAPKANDFEADTVQPGYRRLVLNPDGSFETKVFRLPEGSWMPDLSQPGY